MSSRLFRFGIVAAVPPNNQSWTEQARRVEELGYQTLHVPDTLATLATFPALAAAAAVTTTLRVGTYVLATPNHRPAAVAHQALTLDILSGGRLELGLGIGRPDAQQEAEMLDVPFGTPGERIRHLRATIEAVRDRYAKPFGRLQPVQQPHPPIMIAAVGSRMLQLAAAEADIVAFGLPIEATDEDLVSKTAELRDYAGDRFDQLEIALNLAAVGNEPTPWLAQMVGADPAELLAKGAVSAIAGTPAQMADTLRRRRDRSGLCYIQVNGLFAEQFAPVVEILTGT
jgi:probable F420-dependent oxidoreductase